jgi:hypothetical protein
VLGVGEGLSLAEKRGMAYFLVGGLEGMATAIARRLITEELPALNNELPSDENYTLLRTKNIASSVSTILDHLGLHLGDQVASIKVAAKRHS